MKTIQFFSSMGVVPGYNHQNENMNPVETVGLVWQKIAAQYLKETGVYVSAVISSAKAVYHTEWGCPEGGENIALITGTCNPKYTEVSTYKKSVTEVLKRVAIELKQSTTQVTFQETEFTYFDFR